MFGDNQYFNPYEDNNNFIHSTAIVGPNVLMGKGNHVGPFCLIEGHTRIGNNNRFEAYCSVGTDAEHQRFRGKGGLLTIGNSCWIREFTTINAGTDGTTTLGNRITMLRGSHVGHDSVIGYDVTLSCNAILGGHSHLFPYVNFGLGAVCHQRSIIGAAAMIGMNSTVVKKSQILPGMIYVGSPVEMKGENKIAMQRYGITEEIMEEYKKQYYMQCDQD
jgi:UDP-N-acetylglucosamine acyltransferase